MSQKSNSNLVEKTSSYREESNYLSDLKDKARKAYASCRSDKEFYQRRKKNYQITREDEKKTNEEEQNLHDKTIKS